jgi:hypothetical protein
MKTYKVVALAMGIAGLALGSASFIGYSGAPGASGTCAGSCHGASGGTIEVAGFPMNYTPGQAYTITVAHNGGSSIENFNASVRVGTGSANAGTIAAGTNTAVYNVSGETNGVHFSGAGNASGTFTWTAPSPGVGAVKLYLAGHQGATVGGKNTEIVLTAQSAGIAENGRAGNSGPKFALEQTVVRTHLVVRVTNLESATRIRVIDRTGRVVGRVTVKAGANQAVAVPLLDRNGKPPAAGAYFATFAGGRALQTSKFVVVAR